MELRTLNGINQPVDVVGNQNFAINQLDIGAQGGQQSPSDQMNRSPANVYRGMQQQQHHLQQQQQQLRFVKHRELPVDVPDSFVGMAKQSPRYPPPKPHRQVSPSMPNNNLTTFNQNAPTASSYTNTNKSASVNPNTEATTTTKNGHSNSTNPTQQQQSAISPLSQSTSTNIMNHNSSLRSSIKLQQLEKSNVAGQMQPAINQAFELDEGDINQGSHPLAHQQASSTCVVINNTNNSGPVQQQQQLQKVKQPMTDLCSVYNRLQRNLNGDFANVSGDAKLSKLLSIYNTIVQTHNKQFKIPALIARHTNSPNQDAVSYKVSDLLQSVVYLLNDENAFSPNEASELLSIICKHEIAGVCSAFDRIVQSFEFAKSTSPASSPLQEQPPSTYQLNSHGQQQAQQIFHQQQQSPTQQHNLYPPPHQAANHLTFQSSLDGQQQTLGQHQTLVNNYGYPEDQVHMDIENNLYHNGNGLHSLHDLSDGAYTKTVKVEKSSKQALGATIVNGTNNSVMIGRILCDGAAQKSGLLQKGDEVIEVNGVSMRGKNINEVVNLVENMTGTLTFTIVARNYNKQLHGGMQEKVYVRAFFKYDSEDDNFIPCKELGLSFEVGEVLVILDQSDKGWWQAKRENDNDCHLPGLIPSINLLKEREKLSNTENSAQASPKYMKHKKKNNLVSLLFNCPQGTSPRRRNKFLNMTFPELPYYEELAIHYPDQYRKRPIILVGPKMIGQREIVARLSQDKSKFANPIAHTSRPMQAHERNGEDFYFVSREQFRADIQAGKFIECGQFKEHYYGTTPEAIMAVVKSKRTCVHLINAPSIYNFRQGRAGAELKPFFVFIKPDDSHPDKLRNIVRNFSQQKSNIEEDIRSIMAEVLLIEDHYLPFFDKVISVTDVDQAYEELLKEIECIEKNPNWIPHFWKTKYTQSG